MIAEKNSEQNRKYRVIFQGCNHERIMTDEELSRPSRQVFDGSTSDKVR
jgi:hypothetical protein